MIRFFQQLGYYIAIPLIPSTDILTAEDRRLFVSGQQRLVTPQGSTTNLRLYEHPDAVFQSLPTNSRTVEQGIGATLQDAHHFSISGNARIVNIGQQVNNRSGTYGLDTLEKFVSFSALHDSSTQDPERRCYPGTRKGVLGQIHNWADDPSRPEHVLWLHGPAGAGKSAIAQTISCSYGRDKVGATFFFFRSDPIRNDGNRLIPTLAWQLALSVPTVKDLIALSLEEYPDLPRKAIEAQFDQLIAQPFLTISGGESAAPTSIRVIVIDGLDECTDLKLQRRILKIIESAVVNPRFPLRFIISSRPEAHIEDFFAKFQYPILQIDLANVDEAYRDIETYLTSEFARIAVDQGLDPKVWPGQNIIDSLVSQSSGQFVYASTVIKYVGDEYESAVAQLNVILGLKLWTGKSPFAELDALYKEILQRQPDQDFLKEFLPILVARSMLEGFEDIGHDDPMLLGLDEKELCRKLRGMHSLLKSNPFIDVHHKSFLDFLDDPSRSGEYHISKHFANRRYMQLITDLLVKVASRAMKRADCHEGDHFKPKFAEVIRRFLFPIKLLLNDLEEILRPLLVIQETLLQLPKMSVPWEPRACHECWTFYMIDDLLLHLAWFRGTTQPQELQYVGIRPLTATEEKQMIPQLDLDACLSLLLANLRSAELSLDVDTIGLVRALVRFDPTETAMKVQSITDAQNLVELIFCLNKNQCFKSWFGVATRNAIRLAVAIYGRVPLLPRSLFLNSADLDSHEETYQERPSDIWRSEYFVQRECFDAFMWGNLSYDMGPSFEVYSNMTDNGSISLYPRNDHQLSTAPLSRITPTSIKDFDVIKLISKGAFGSVFLAKKKATGDYYEIKVLKKADVKAEWMIFMKQAESPFVAKLYFTFQSKDNLYLVMEYLNGGDCTALINSLGSLPEEWTKQYVTEIILGLEYLHQSGIVHHDLRPDNLLIDQHGHLKLADLGLSRIGLFSRRTRDGYLGRLHTRQSRPPGMDLLSSPPIFTTEGTPGGSHFNQRSSATIRVMNSYFDNVSRCTSARPGKPNFVGSPDYLAPETILGLRGDDATVDWWALGVITYGFLYGIPPFHADTPEKVFENILSGHVDWHEDWIEFSPEVLDFVKRLLTLDPSQRLGSRGSEEVKAHPFFAGVDWEKVTTTEAAFIPQLADPESTVYFSP